MTALEYNKAVLAKERERKFAGTSGDANSRKKPARPEFQRRMLAIALLRLCSIISETVEGAIEPVQLAKRLT